MALKNLTPYVPNPSGVLPRLQFAFLRGGSAGNHTLTGIAVDVGDVKRDALLAVIQLDLTLTEGTPNTTNQWTATDRTSEFSISAADTINNTGGTDTTGDLLFVVWWDGDYGESSNVQGVID